jgi:hypothetical protein
MGRTVRQPSETKPFRCLPLPPREGGGTELDGEVVVMSLNRDGFRQLFVPIHAELVEEANSLLLWASRTTCVFSRHNLGPMLFESVPVFVNSQLPLHVEDLSTTKVVRQSPKA